jgi:hypothetical protein
MNPLGWFVMLLSIGSVLALTAFCLYRVLTLPPIEAGEIHSRLEMETRVPTEDE